MRKADKRHLVTVGLVDWSLDAKGLTSGFVPDKVTEKLDFLCVHLYPESGKLDEAAKTLKGFAVGKPVVVEETFPLKCSPKELDAFIGQVGPDAAGWVSFYWGTPPDTLRKSKAIGDAILLDWLERFQKRGAAPATPTSTDWPRWRGPNADGISESRNLPVKWSTTEYVLWSAELPGWGTSSPVVSGDRVFVTSQVTEGAKKSLLTLCFDRKTGKELWRHDFGFGVDQKVHAKSNLAVNTPAVTPDAVYVAFGNADVARYTHEGKLVWVRRYLKEFEDPKMAWGYAVSPLVLDDSVLFPWNHHKGPCFLIGLDKKTGEIAWKKERPRPACSPPTSLPQAVNASFSCFVAGSTGFSTTGGFTSFPVAGLPVPSVCPPARLPAANTATPNASTATAVVISFLRNMVFSTPFVRMATGPEITPAAFPVARRVATLIADVTTDAGTFADATEFDRVAANDPPDTAIPRRVSRFASSSLALASPLATVPSGHPSCRATSLRVWPSRSHRTINARNRSGSRLNS